jgi:hypothetical protein
METLQHVLEKLDGVPIAGGAADSTVMDSVVAAINQLGDPREAVQYLFRWFEANARVNVGSPGSFVHFIERNPDYWDELDLWLNRKPTQITVWMANRIANGCTDVTKQRWLNLLNMVVKHPLGEVSCKESARHFLDRQARR